jgi:hypothetical protein
MGLIASIRSALPTALFLAACAQSALCADYKGTMDFVCCGTVFHLSGLHDQKGRRVVAKEVILRLHQGCPGTIPLEKMVCIDGLTVQAEVCEPGSKRCETAAAAKIYLDLVSKNGKHASGNFAADFPNAGHKEGKFTVKYHHEGPRIICE